MKTLLLENAYSTVIEEYYDYVLQKRIPKYLLVRFISINNIIIIMCNELDFSDWNIHL